MKIVLLQVAYERVAHRNHFNVELYKRAIQCGMLERLSNAGFEDSSKLEAHIRKFLSVEKVLLSK